MPSKEAEELGPEPRGTEADLWREERWGAVGLLAGLADDNVELVRQAANETDAEWTDREAARLRGCGRQCGGCGLSGERSNDRAAAGARVADGHLTVAAAHAVGQGRAGHCQRRAGATSTASPGTRAEGHGVGGERTAASSSAAEVLSRRPRASRRPESPQRAAAGQPLTTVSRK